MVDFPKQTTHLGFMYVNIKSRISLTKCFLTSHSVHAAGYAFLSVKLGSSIILLNMD